MKQICEMVMRFLFVGLLCLSFLVPAEMARPQDVQAGVMKWDTVSTPNSILGRNDILNPEDPTIGGPWGSEIQDLAVGGNDGTLAAIVRTETRYIYPTVVPAVVPSFTNVLFCSANSGISFTITKQQALDRATDWFSGPFTPALRRNLYQVVVAPDNPNIIAVTSDDAPLSGPRSVWITADGGANWDQFMADAFLLVGETIHSIDLSVDYGGGKRDVLVATYMGAGGRLLVKPAGGFKEWQAQPAPIAGVINYFTVKFSPSYTSDASIIAVFGDAVATYYNVGLRDLDQNTTLSWAFSAPGVEVKDPTAAIGNSPDMFLLRKVGLELPGDFSGQSASLRRAYISLDATGKGINTQTGIFRVDDSTVYRLMDTTSTLNKDIYSIAYYGTYASGKLLAGERNGFPCTATVPTWFTDSPTTCPIPCWYPALKPTTGAAGQVGCIAGTQTGVGAALVAWNASGSLALVATGSNAVIQGPGWFTPWLALPIPNDESAFAISRNNGETWNQLSLIDTTIDWFNDVVSSPDCTTLYLASVNRNTGLSCNEFDSVWRSTVSMTVASPLPAVHPVGQYWERVFTHVTASSCSEDQTDLPILRLPTGCKDKPNGEIVAWAAQGSRAQAWSPDFGDYWAVVTPRYTIQDFCFETSTILYDLSPAGMVQKLPYTGTSWSTNLPGIDTTLMGAHTITAYPEGHVIVGANQDAHAGNYAVAYSGNMRTGDPSFRLLTGAGRTADMGDVHVAFDPDFSDNNFFYICDEAMPTPATTVGSVYRNSITSELPWLDTDMMSRGNNASGSAWPPPSVGPPHNFVGQYGLVVAYTGDPQPALYSAHHSVVTSPSAGMGILLLNSAVCRTLEPRTGIPKPGIGWDCLDIFAPGTTNGVLFTLEPASLKSCGCCSIDTDTTLYAIDNESGGTALSGRWNAPLGSPLSLGYAPTVTRGMLWAYTDCLAKRPPVLLSPASGALIGCDPVTGRNQQVDLAWEQLCLATQYYVAIAKDQGFELLVWGDNVNMDATNMLHPAMWLAPGALPEAGATYYWKVQVTRSATGQIATSPSSRPRPFSIKPGFRTGSPYLGVALLSPNNGCVACKVKPAAFSWSPWKEATKYEFVLAKDSELKQVIETATVSSTGYEYDGTLDYSTNYFWRVRALEINGLPIPSDWSATFSFQTEPAPEPAAPLAGEPIVPLMILIAAAVSVLLIILILVLIVRTGR